MAMIEKKKKTRVHKATSRRGIGRPTSPLETVGRERLLKLTCELLKSTHHKSITRSSIARMAGVDPSLLRYYFNSLEDLLFAAAEELTVEFRHYFEEALAGSGESPRSRIYARIHALVEMTAAYPFYSRLISEEVMHADNEKAKQIFATLMDRGIGSLAPVISDGVARGEFRNIDPAMLFSAMVGMGEFFLHAKRRTELAPHLSDTNLETLKDRYKRFIADLIFSGISAGNVGLEERS